MNLEDRDLMKVKRFNEYNVMIDEIISLLKEQLTTRSEKPYAVILPGGATPLPVYEEIEKNPFPIEENAYVIMSDERYVSESSKFYNYGKLSGMVQALGIDESQVLNVDTSLDFKSATDDSVGKRTKGNKKLRKRRAARMRKLLESEFKATADVTTNLSKASSFGLERSTIDASITRLDRRVRGPYIEIECEIRLAISDDRGKMLSFLTGGAKVQIPKRTFRKKYLRQIQLEAIENAVKSAHQDLITHLRRHPNRS